MNSSLEFAPDAMSQWRELDVELQELVLDELEIRAKVGISATPFICDIVHESKGARHYVFLSLIPRSGTLTVICISHFSRPSGPPPVDASGAS